MVDITIRVKNADEKRLSSVIYRLMRGTDLTRIVLNEKSLCYFFVDMDTDEFSDMLACCDHERE